LSCGIAENIAGAQLHARASHRIAAWRGGDGGVVRRRVTCRRVIDKQSMNYVWQTA